MSLRKRLILLASIVLTFFILIAGYALDRAFYETAETSLHNNLNNQLILLLGGAELNDANDIDMTAQLLETKFSLPSSGLYAVIVNDKGIPLWKSLSTIGVTFPKPQILKAGEKELHKVSVKNRAYYVLSYGVAWYTQEGPVPLTFNVMSNLDPFYAQINNYRRTLWGWLIGLAVILLLAQLFILIWGLQPLRNVISELNQIEDGHQERIKGSYPKEIWRLTDNINALLEHERTQQTRYRNALADLAHSLKTPLAVMRGALNEMPADNHTSGMDEQIERMDHIIAHQLQRAATAGASPIRKSIKIKPYVDKLTRVLNKVYQDKNLQFDIVLSEEYQVRVDEDDLMELLGNILENACKYGHQRIRISLTNNNNHQRLYFTIADDGPGIPEDKVALILERGGRIDMAKPGQGIGLTVALDIIHAYKGNLSITQGDLGGAAFSFDLPAG